MTTIQMINKNAGEAMHLFRSDEEVTSLNLTRVTEMIRFLV